MKRNPYLLLFLLKIVSTSNEFSDFDELKSLIFESADKFKCFCIFVVKPVDFPNKKTVCVNKLARKLARGEIKNGRHKFYQVATRKSMDIKPQSVGNFDTCIKSMVVFMDEDSTNQQLSETLSTHKDDETSHTIYMIFRVTLNSSNFETMNLRYDSQLYALTRTSSDSSQGAHLSEIYRISENHPVHVNFIGSWSPYYGFSSTGHSIFVRRGDLSGKTFKTAILEVSPFAAFYTLPDGTEILDGICPIVWMELERILNFSSRHLHALHGDVGVPIDGGNWNGMIGMIVRGEADVVLEAITYSRQRFSVLTYLFPIIHTRTDIYFHITTNEFAWLNIFKPLHKSIWFCVITWVFIGPLVLWYCNYMALKNGLQGNEDIGYISFLFVLFQSISNQGYEITPKVAAIRLLFITCSITAFLLLTGFSVSLISSLADRTPRKPYDNLYQLLESGHKLIVARGTPSWEYFEAGETDILRKVFQKLILPSEAEVQVNVSNPYSLKEATRLVCEKSGYATVAFEEVVQIIFPRFQPNCKLSRFSKPLLSAQHGMALAKHSPFRTVINHNILRLIERGVLRRIKNHHQTEWVEDSSGEDSLISVEFFAILGIFVLFVGAVIASPIILVIERLHYFASMRKKTQ